MEITFKLLLIAGNYDSLYAKVKFLVVNLVLDGDLSIIEYNTPYIDTKIYGTLFFARYVLFE